MSARTLSRRQLFRMMAASGACCAAQMASNAAAKTPHISAEEMAAIEYAFGKKGRYVQAEATYTLPLPRNDLQVRIKGDRLPAQFGFGGWVSIKKTLDGRSAVLMSDTVLLEGEVNKLISSAQDQGLKISALHNHFFYEEPRIFYMHLAGVGSVADLARRYAAAIRDTPLWAGRPQSSERAVGEIFDLAALDRIVGQKGAPNGPTYKYTVARRDLTVMAMGAEVTAAMGLNSWAALAGAPDRAHIAGDIAMLESEVNAVIRALRRHDLEIVALHHHMLGERPRIIFLHYYGRGPAQALARGFRAALDQLGNRRPSGS
jgi:hypothetical protein